MNSNIYRTTAQVTIFSIIEKSVSFLYRIILSQVLGAEGVGIYQIALSVFSVFLTAASSGIPVTVSRLITKQNATGGTKGKHAVVTAGILCTLIFTVPVCIVIFAGRNIFSLLFSDKRCFDVFLIILPGLILTSVYAVMRGTFWGEKQFMPYSLIELAEDSFMVILGCVLVCSCTSAADGAMRAGIAVFISYIFSFIVSLGWYFHKGGKLVNPKKQLKPLLSSSLPITAMRTSSSILNSLAAVLMPFMLVNMCGMTNSDAVSLYGVAAGMSIPILFIPSSLIGSIAVVLAPELSENFYRNKTEKLKDDIEKSLKTAILISLFLIPLLFALGKTMGDLLFSDELSGEIVRNCCIILLPMCISMITNTILNSMNREKQTLIYYFAGAAAMLICITALTALVGIYSYVIGLGASFVVTAVLNIRLLKKLCREVKIFSFISKGIAVCTVCCLFGILTVNLLEKILPPIALLAAGGIITACFTLAFMYAAKMFAIIPFKDIIKRRKMIKG